MSVLALILTASYALANRSLQAVRQAQERSEAQNISSAQVESLRAFLSNSTNTAPAVAANFCLSGGTVVNVPNINAVPSQCAAGTDGRYKTYITRDNTGTYTAHTSWDRISGGTDQLTFTYKVYLAGDINIDLSGGTSGGDGGCGDVRTEYNPATGSCDPIPPSIRVAVRKVSPGPGNTTPTDCNGVTTGVSGINVNLVGPGKNLNQVTDVGASTIFTGLDFGQTYTASYSVPTTTVATSSGNAYYEACDSTSRPITTIAKGGPETGNQTKEEIFKFRPICRINSVTTGNPASYYGDPYPIYGWVQVSGEWKTFSVTAGGLQDYVDPSGTRWIYDHSRTTSPRYWWRAYQWQQTSTGYGPPYYHSYTTTNTSVCPP